MARFRKGTLDHDGDGKIGGSNPKETSMGTPKKAPAKKPTIKADGQNQMNSAAAAQAESVQKGSKSTAHSGEEPTPKDRRAELNRQFEKADEDGKAAIIDETQVGLQVRGY